MKTYAKFSLAAAGLAAIIAGIYAVMNPKVAIEAMSVVLGLFLLFAGINTLWFYAAAAKGLPGASWLLFDGIVSVAAAVAFIFNNHFVAEALPVLFGLWMMVCGADKILHALNARKQGRAKGAGELILGGLCAAAGVLAIAAPAIGTFAISFMLGCCFVIYGFALIAMWNTLRKMENFGR